MLSRIQQIKHRYIFSLLDFDNNGYIEKSDFQEIAENLCMVRGEDIDTDDSQEIFTQCMKLWEGLAFYIDENRDSQCTINEWLKFIENHLVKSQKDEASLYLNKTVKGIFDLYDVDQDGNISWDEYLDLFLSFRINSSLVAKSFNLLDANDDHSLSRDELVNALKEFIISDDIKSPGNWMFGNLFDQAA